MNERIKTQTTKTVVITDTEIEVAVEEWITRQTDQLPKDGSLHVTFNYDGDNGGEVWLKGATITSVCTEQ